MKKLYEPILIILFTGTSAYCHMDSTSLAVKCRYNENFIQFFNNPAYVGAEECHIVYFNYNRQWLAIQNAPGNFRLSYDNAWGKKKTYATGVNVSLHRQGNMSLKTLELSGAGKIQLNEKLVLRLGLALSFNDPNVKGWDTLLYSDMIDYDNGFVRTTEETEFARLNSYVNIGSGIWLEHQSFYFGLSALNIYQQYFNVIKEDPSFQYWPGLIKPDPVPLIFNFIGGYYMKVNGRIIFNPSVSLVESRGNGKLLITPTLLAGFKNKYWSGVSIRNLNSVQLHAGMQLLKFLRLYTNVGIPLNAQLAEISKISLLEGGLKFQF